MLHKETVSGATLDILTRLMNLPALEKFVLVGGANLTLRFGHWLSIDLDLFTNQPFEPEYIYRVLESTFEGAVLASQSEQMLLVFINDLN
jgi:hypothetical protein